MQDTTTTARRGRTAGLAAVAVAIGIAAVAIGIALTSGAPAPQPQLPPSPRRGAPAAALDTGWVSPNGQTRLRPARHSDGASAGSVASRSARRSPSPRLTARSSP